MAHRKIRSSCRSSKDGSWKFHPYKWIERPSLAGWRKSDTLWHVSTWFSYKMNNFKLFWDYSFHNQDIRGHSYASRENSIVLYLILNALQLRAEYKMKKVCVCTAKHLKCHSASCVWNITMLSQRWARAERQMQEAKTLSYENVLLGGSLFPSLNSNMCHRILLSNVRSKMRMRKNWVSESGGHGTASHYIH